MYQLQALFRFLAFYLLRPLMVRGVYDNPDHVMGYTGWYDFLGIRARWACIAFTHREDGMQFRW